MKKNVHISGIKPNNVEIRSIYNAQLLELAEIRNPGVKKERWISISKEMKKKIRPVYVEFSWIDEVLECVGAEEFFELKTNRNQQLITKDEQQQLRDLNISIAGMSVGSSALYGLVGSGMGNIFNIADDDSFSSTNLNRVSVTLLDVNESKAEVAYVRAKEMDPFITVNTFNERINRANISNFMHNGEVDIIIEEIDDIKMKITMRDYAKKIKKPLVMMTNVGDRIIIDVERYDREVQTEPFNGLVDSAVLDRIRNEEMSKELMHEFITSLIDSNLMSERIIESLSEVGRSLVGRPQLYGTVAIDGGIAPYIVRRVFLNDIKSGRYSLDISSIFMI